MAAKGTKRNGPGGEGCTGRWKEWMVRGEGPHPCFCKACIIRNWRSPDKGGA